MEKTGASPLRAVRIFSMRVTKLQAKSVRIIGKDLMAEVQVGNFCAGDSPSNTQILGNAKLLFGHGQAQGEPNAKI